MQLPSLLLLLPATLALAAPHSPLIARHAVSDNAVLSRRDAPAMIDSITSIHDAILALEDVIWQIPSKHTQDTHYMEQFHDATSDLTNAIVQARKQIHDSKVLDDGESSQVGSVLRRLTGAMMAFLQNMITSKEKFDKAGVTDNAQTGLENQASQVKRLADTLVSKLSAHYGVAAENFKVEMEVAMGKAIKAFGDNFVSYKTEPSFPKLFEWGNQ